MAKSISEEELQLRKRARRRLIGAIAVVTIVAVFLPMILDHEPRPVSQDISIRIPAPDAGIFTSKIAPVPSNVRGAKSTPEPAPLAKPDSAQSDAPKTAAASAKQAAELPPAYDTEAAPPKKVVSEQLRPKAKPGPTPPARIAAVPAAEQKPTAAIPAEAKFAGGFVVQVAALNDVDKAKQIQAQIAAAGVKSYTEVVPTAKGNVTRIRAGPFATRDEADKMRDKLKDMGLNGNIVPK